MTHTTDADCRLLAVFLFRHGPTPGPTIRSALGWDVSRFLDVVYGADDRRFTATAEGWSLAGEGKSLTATRPH